MIVARSTENLRLVNSCMVGSQWYRIADNGKDQEDHLIEEIFNKVRQTSLVPYEILRARDGERLWMTRFQSSEPQLNQLLDTLEYIQSQCLGGKNIFFPVDIVADNDTFGCVYLPIDKKHSKPIRCFTPCEEGPRWQIVLHLFQTVQQLHDMGLTSNGLSRSQLRCDPVTGEIALWLNHTVSATGTQKSEILQDHSDCFLNVPDFTADVCSQKGFAVQGEQRDVFSAAVLTFYILLHTHPFIGSDYFSRLRGEYELHYQMEPKYIFEPNTSNCPGNMALDTMTLMQWNQTEPRLKKLFDQIFMAVTAPEQHWSTDLECWDLSEWMEALILDHERNKDASCAIPQGFTREWQRLV